MTRKIGWLRWLTDKGTQLGLSVLGVGFVLLALPEIPGFPVGATVLSLPIEKLLHELGGAFFIAGLLALTLERVLVSRLTEEVRAGVEAYYLTYGLPKEFADEVIYVRDVKKVRKDYSVRLRMWDLPDGKVTTELQISYTVVNYSTSEIDYKSQIATEVEDTAQIVRVTRIGSDLSSEAVIEKPKSPYAELVKIKPNSRDPHNTFEYVIRRVTTKSYGFDFILMTEPAVNVRFVVETCPADVRFDVAIGHRDGGQVTRVPAESPSSWRLDKAFFPGAGIMFEWKVAGPAQLPPPQGQTVPEAVPAGVAATAAAQPIEKEMAPAGS